MKISKILEDMKNEAKTKNIKTILQEIKKELHSSEFNMGKSPNDGNGFAIVKGNNLIIQDPRYYMTDKKSIEYKKKDWTEGTYFKYFSKKYPGIKIKFVKYEDIIGKSAKKKFDMPGYDEYTFEVSI